MIDRAWTALWVTCDLACVVALIAMLAAAVDVLVGGITVRGEHYGIVFTSHGVAIE